MSSKISASDIRNIHIYNGKTHSRELGLCLRHQSNLSGSISKKLNELVSEKFFQDQFKGFLPNPNEHVHVRIRITDHNISVQKISKNGSKIGKPKTVDFDDVENSRGASQVKNINQTILNKADRIYQNHLQERRPRDRSRFLRPRRAAYERRERQEELFHQKAEKHERNQPRRHAQTSPLRNRPVERSTTSSSDDGESSSFQEEGIQTASPKKRSHSRETERGACRKLEFSLLTKHLDGYRQKKRKPLHTFVPLQPPRKKSLQTLPEQPPIKSVTDDASTTARASIEELALPNIQKNNLEPKVKTLSNENEALKLPLPKLTPLISSEDFETFIQLSQSLSATDFFGSTQFPEDLKTIFMKLPEATRNAIYYQIYLLVDPLDASEPWPIGQKLFEGTPRSISATNLVRSHAIRHFLLDTLANDFASVEGKCPPPELMKRFTQLTEEDKNAVYTQLEFIQPKGDDYRGPAHAFAGVDRLSVTNQERSIAIHRVTNDRIAEYHRHRYREEIKAMEEAFQEAYKNLIKQTG